MSIDKQYGDWDREAQLTAFALGELEGPEREEIARLVAEDDAARALIEEVRGVALELEAGLAKEADVPEPLGLTAMQLARVTRAAEAGSSGARAAHWTRRAAPWGLAAAAVMGGVLLVPRLLDSMQADGVESEVYSGTAQPPTAEASYWMPVALNETYDGKMIVKREAEVGAIRESLSALSYGEPVLEEAEEAYLLDFDVEVDEEAQLAQSEDSNREGYDRIHENEFVATKEDAYSTFSIDVDTASYSNVRRFLRRNQPVPPDAVRIEELVNYFPYAADAPTSGEHPFSVKVEVTEAPWRAGHQLARITLRADDPALDERKRSSLVFLLDVSGSMDNPDKLPLVKKAMRLLVEQLGEGDRVSIVVYAGSEGLALDTTPGDAREAILQAIERLDAGGSTNGGAGIELAYRKAVENYVEGGVNRVILCTDGDFNVGVSSDGALERLIEDKAKSGVFLTVLGFGTGNYQDAKMEKLSNRGNGNFAYIDSELEARKVLVEELGGTLATVAKDVKIQVEFNPARVQAARLIGYENRVLAHRDFLDDTKDAGEIGAGHTVTALYEIVPVGVPFEVREVPESRYQPDAAPAVSLSDELMVVRLRYKQPEGDVSTGFEVPVEAGASEFHAASTDTRFAAAVASFGMLLRGSEHKGTATLEDVRRWTMEALGDDPGGYREGFLELVDLAREQ